MSPRKLAGGKLLLDHPAEALARLTLSNPDNRNALDHETLDALADALPRLDRGVKIRCVLITGQGRPVKVTDDSISTGLVLPGDRVDVLVYLSRDVVSPVTKTFLTDVTVFAVNEHIERMPQALFILYFY